MVTQLGLMQAERRRMVDALSLALSRGEDLYGAPWRNWLGVSRPAGIVSTWAARAVFNEFPQIVWC